MTTRQLVLIRHAKTAAGTIDIERPLAERGIVDSTAIGRWLASLGISLDRVVVSPATRARQTWATAASQTTAADAVTDPRVYENTVADLLAVIRGTPEAVTSLALVGHNPSMGELAGVLDDGAGDEAARDALAGSFPTSAVAVFDVAAPWKDVDAGGGTLTSFAAPRG